jgi:hypothetical protein
LTRADLHAHVDAIETSYEFFLAYAAQGIVDGRASNLSGELQGFLARTDDALQAIADGLPALIESERLAPAEAQRELAAVITRDARTSLAAVRAVRARPSISSQLIDNLNAFTHLRALLTDLFLLDELLKEPA